MDISSCSSMCVGRCKNLYSLKPTLSYTLVVKYLSASAGDIRDVGLIPCVGKISWRRACQLTPGLLCGESHGQTNLVGYSP